MLWTLPVPIINQIFPSLCESCTVKTRLVSFLHKNEILHKRQSGFLQKRTTMFPLIDVVAQYFENINSSL